MRVLLALLAFSCVAIALFVWRQDEPDLIAVTILDSPRRHDDAALGPFRRPQAGEVAFCDCVSYIHCKREVLRPGASGALVPSSACMARVQDSCLESRGLGPHEGRSRDWLPYREFDVLPECLALLDGPSA